MKSVSERFYSEMYVDTREGVVLKYRDGTFPSVDELDSLKQGAFIYDSVYRATLAAREVHFAKPRCQHCGSIL